MTAGTDAVVAVTSTAALTDIDVYLSVMHGTDDFVDPSNTGTRQICPPKPKRPPTQMGGFRLNDRLLDLKVRSHSARIQGC